MNRRNIKNEEGGINEEKKKQQQTTWVTKKGGIKNFRGNQEESRYARGS
jgi:hypothetical protein